jgi:hypothetical protein
MTTSTAAKSTNLPDNVLAQKHGIEVGRRVHYWPSTAMATMQRMTLLNPEKPLHARIVHVFHDRMVNIVAYDNTGNMHAITSVSVVYPGEVADEGRDHCEPVRSPIGRKIAPAEATGINALHFDLAQQAMAEQLSAPSPTSTYRNSIPDAVSMLMVEDEVLAEYHMNALDLAKQRPDEKSTIRDGYPGLPSTLGNTDICVLVMRNGHVIVGTSACISSEKYSRSAGREFARGNAIDTAWKLMGYELRSRRVNAGIDAI